MLGFIGSAFGGGGAFTNLLIGIVFTLISYWLSPKPQSPDPAELEDLGIPKVKEGDEVGIVYGTSWIRSPQIHWYGDFKSKAIKKSAKGK